MTETGYVYTLVDPRDNDPVYVGATKNPEQRLLGHQNGHTNEDVEEWIDELAEDGLTPEMVVVDVANLEDLSDSELEVMERLSEEYELLNQSNRGYTVSNRFNNTEKVPKTVTLSVDVAERLEEEQNQSEATEAALREYYDISEVQE